MRRIGLAVLATAAALTLTACGDDDDDGGGASKEPATFAVTATGTGKAQPKVAAPASIPSGLVRMTFTNKGDKQRDAQLIHVTEGHTAAEVVKVTSAEDAPIPSWLQGGGGVGQTAPNATSTVTQVLEPGSWVLLVEADEENSKPVARELTVKDDGNDLTLPATDAKVTASEYTFAATGLKPGRNLITFENAGKQLHHMIAFPVNKGATEAQVRAAFASEEEPKGPPPVDFEKFASTAVIDGGQAQVTTVSLTAGRNVLLCFIPDRAGGPPHVAKGMLKIVEVK